MDAQHIRTHFTYNAWKYIVLIAAAVLGWNLIYTTSEYRPPESKRVDVYARAPGLDGDVLQSYLDGAREAVPDMELVQGVTLMTSGEDYYATMQLSVYIAAAEGDIYILPESEFKTYAAQGAFLPLDEYAQSGALGVEKLTLSRGQVTLEDTGERALFGIPLGECAALPRTLGVSGDGLVLAVTYYNGNTENVLKVAARMLADFQAP